ncbi:MAG: mechanosensitive ion channel family protein [Cellvibrionaceae bacterium]
MVELKIWLTEVVGEEHYWIAYVFVVVLATLVAAYILRLVLLKVERRAQVTKTLWDDALIGAIQRPARWLVWLLGLSLAAEVAGRVADVEIFEFVAPARSLGVIALFTWFLVAFVSRVEANLMDPSYTANKPMDPTTVSAMGKLLRISVIITAVLVALQSLGISVAGVMAFGGIGGLAVGFAAKDLLANFFGGLMVYLDRQFAVGEWIRSPDQNIEGVVEDIGWRLTRIRTFDKRPLYVPNSTFTQISVENPSRMLNRRIFETIGVRYADAAKLPAIVAEVKAMIQAHEALDMNQTLIVNFNAFASSSLDFFIYTFTKTTQWVEYHEIKQDVLFRVLEIIESHGAEVAFPTSTIHLPDGIKVDNPVRKPEKEPA